MICLDEEKLFALVDDAASEKDAKVWRQHVDGCERCAKALKAMSNALAAIGEEEPLDVEAHADTVMASLDRAPPRRQRVLVPLVASGLALAAALLLGIGIGRGTKPADPGEFTARGGASAEAGSRRDVAIDVLKRQDGGVTRLRENDEVTPATIFSGEARNLGTAPSSVLVFIVDAKRETHWVYPAYTEPGANPASVSVAPAKDFTSLGSGAAFADLAPGPATVLVVVTSSPAHVDEIERTRDVATESLRRRFDDIRSIPIRVKTP